MSTGHNLLERLVGQHAPHRIRGRVHQDELDPIVFLPDRLQLDDVRLPGSGAQVVEDDLHAQEVGEGLHQRKGRAGHQDPVSGTS